MSETTPATSPAPADAAPRTNRVELLQQLTGTIGTVYKARNPKIERLVALRQIQVPEWLDDVNDLIKRMMEEARAANLLEHPGIARLYTGGFKEVTVFLTSEFIEGPTLREYVSSKNPGLPEIMALAKQLCAALDYAHEKKVVHYALNPANIKVLPGGTLKILDFGLLREKHLYSPIPAKRLENEHYVSPEQLRGKPADRTANLFSVATILYELFTTRNPFAGKHLGEVDRNITDVEPHAASLAHPRVSEAVSKVLMKALSKSPAARFQTGQELIAALEEAMSAAPAKAAAATAAANSTGVRAAGTTASIPKAPPTNGSSTGVTAAVPASRPQAPPAPKTMTSIKPVTTTSRNAVPAAPAKLPAKALVQWKLVAALVAALFMVSAAAISLRHRSDTPPPEAPANENVASQKPVTVEPVAMPGSSIEVHEVQRSRSGHEKASKVELPAAPVAVAEGQLAVTSSPDGAVVEIAGRGESWKTPQTIVALTPGTYKVTISKAGYASETRNVEVASGSRAALDVKLTLTKGYLTITSTPAGVHIAIDGKETGKVSPAEFTLDPAVHSVTLHQEGYLDSTSDIKLAAGQSVSYSPSLKLAGRTDNIQVVGGFKKMFGGKSGQGMARMEIKTDPKGAAVTINGTSLNKTTPLEIQLEPGNYEITLQKDGYKPVHTSVLAQANDKLKIDESLKK